MSVSLTLNQSQRRVYSMPFVIEGDVSRFDERLSVNVLHFDDMACLMPRQLTASWIDPTSAASRRWNLSDYQTEAGGALSPSTWTLYERTRPSDYYLTWVSPTASRVYSSQSWPINRAFHLDFWISPGLNPNQVAIDFGWGNHGTAGTVGLRVRANGSLELYKWQTTGAAPVRIAYTDKRVEFKQKKGSTGVWASMLLIPCSRRDIVVVWGDGYERFTLDDLDDTALNTITPAGRVWWYSPDQRPYVQLTEARFLGPGYVWTFPDQLREPPIFPQVSFNGMVYFDQAAPPASVFGGVVGSASVALRSADVPASPVSWTGGQDRCRLMVTLTGSTQYTPFVYAAYAATGSATGLTPDSRASLSTKLKSFTLAAEERPGSMKGSLQILEDGTLTTDQRERNGQPLALWAKVQHPDKFALLAAGVLGEPTLKEGARDMPGTVRSLKRDFRDTWQLLEDCIFEEDHYPYDNWTMTDAMIDLAACGGVVFSDIETSSLRLDYVRPQGDDKWSWRPKAGDTVAQWLIKIWETLASDWILGTFPAPTTLIGSTFVGSEMGFRFRSKTSMGTTPKATIWYHREGIYDGSRIPCFEFEETRHPPAATSINVFGFDPTTRTLIQGRWKDASTWNPTTAVTSRPEGWVGRSLPVTVVSERLKRPETVDQARAQLQAALGSTARDGRWVCPLLTVAAKNQALWIGDCVEIRPASGSMPSGNPSGGIFRITSVDVSRWTRDPDTAGNPTGLRKTGYSGERVGNITG